MATPEYDRQRDTAASDRDRSHEQHPAAGGDEYDEYGDATARGSAHDDTSTRGSAHDDTAATTGLVDGSSELFERWQRVQSGFVDAPRESVHEAGGIVEDVLSRLSSTFEDERRHLDQAWDAGEEPTTEELRRALRRYREFFERLLAA